MMSGLQPEYLLIALLAAIALVGVMVGWFAQRIAAGGKYNRLMAENNARFDRSQARVSSLEKELEESQALAAEHQSLKTGNARLTEQVDGFEKEKDEIAQLLERREKRIKTLESQVSQAEEQYVKGQRDFAKMRLLKAREVQRLQQQVDSLKNPDAPLAPEDELPVLLKKANSAKSAHNRTSASPERSDAEKAAKLETLPDITHANLDSGEDVFEMTNEFDFDPEELLAPFDADADKA